MVLEDGGAPRAQSNPSGACHKCTGATVLYSRDLLSSALRRSGMITPAGVTPAGAPVTPFPTAAAATATAETMQAPSTPVPPKPPKHNEVAEGNQHWEVVSEGPQAPVGVPGEYSPGTPVRSPSVKLEFTWPDSAWSRDVIDLEEQHELLASWQSESEEESSGCSDSDDSDGFEWSEPPAEREGAPSGKPSVQKKCSMSKPM